MINGPMTKTSWCAALCLALLGTATIRADTLLLRDGRRVEGELVGVNGAIVEFREGTGRRRVLRVDRDEVRAIELEGFSRDRSRLGPGSDGVRPRPRGLREREVTVSGDVPFVDSGIDVRGGQEIYFESLGNVWWKRNEKTGPAGDTGADDRDERRPLPRRPVAALIGKVGQESKDLFFIGADAGPIRVRSSGRLFLGVNDNYFEDNHGNFLVVVYY
jgi:hypothetical protein